MKQNTKDYKIAFHYLPTQTSLKKVLENNYLNYLHWFEIIKSKSYLIIRYIKEHEIYKQ